MSAVHRFTGDPKKGIYAWEDVEPLAYDENKDVEGVLKHVLVGPDDDAPNFIIRYFNVPVGKSSFYEKHPHEHGIVILHGKARVQINDDFYEVGPYDSVFIPGNDIHQLTNIGNSPLGFICVITRRD